MKVPQFLFPRRKQADPPPTTVERNLFADGSPKSNQKAQPNSRSEGHRQLSPRNTPEAQAREVVDALLFVYPGKEQLED